MNSEFKKIPQFVFIINSFLGWLLTVVCLIGFYFFSQFILLIFVIPIIVTAINGFDLSSFITCIFAGLLGSLFFFVGLPIGRFLLRVLPPRLSGKKRIGALLLSALLAITGLANALYRSSHTTGIELIDNAIALSIFVFFAYASMALGYTLVFAIPHLSPRSFLEKPFILFLRRFSTFSDRSIQNAILKVSPAAKPIAFLTSTQSRAGDWDPFRIGFAGLKIWHPIKSTPIFLRSSNEDWKRAAEELINCADVITLDLSQGSGAIQAEIEMIDNSRRWRSTVILIGEKESGGFEAQQLIDSKNKGATILKYKVSWEGAIFRLLLGIPFVSLIGLWLFSFVFLVLIAINILVKEGLDATTHFYRMLGSTLFGKIDPTVITSDPALSEFFKFVDFDSAISTAILLSLAICSWVYFLFFGRPAIDMQATELLRRKFTLTAGLDPANVDRWPSRFAILFDRVFGKKHLSWCCFFRSCVASLLAFIISTIIFMQVAPGEWEAFLQSKHLIPDFIDIEPIVLLSFVAFLNLLPNYASLLMTRSVIQRMQYSRSVMGQSAWLVTNFAMIGVIFFLVVCGYLAFLSIGTSLVIFFFTDAPLANFVFVDLPIGAKKLFSEIFSVWINISLLNPVAEPEQRFVAIPVWTNYFLVMWVWLHLYLMHLTGLLSPKLQYNQPVEQYTLRVIGAMIVFSAFAGYCLVIIPITLVGRSKITSPLEPKMVIIQSGILRGVDYIPEKFLWAKNMRRNPETWKIDIEKKFAIGIHEVTFEEYDRFTRATRRALLDDESWGRGRQPVINVTLDDAVAYAKWLSEQTGKRYRLPTECEREYAARAGTDTIFWWGDEINKDGKVWANCEGCGSQWDGKQSAPVGSFPHNRWGLYDTAGNVEEWVLDCFLNAQHHAFDDCSHFNGTEFVFCPEIVASGGSWRESWESVRFASLVDQGARGRNLMSQTYLTNNNIGFRLVLDLD